MTPPGAFDAPGNIEHVAKAIFRCDALAEGRLAQPEDFWDIRLTDEQRAEYVQRGRAALYAAGEVMAKEMVAKEKTR